MCEGVEGGGVENAAEESLIAKVLQTTLGPWHAAVN